MARKKASLGCLFWTALVLLVIVVFLFNRSAIEDVLERTDLIAVLQRTFAGAGAAEAPADGLTDPSTDVTGVDGSSPAPPGSESGGGLSGDAPGDAQEAIQRSPSDGAVDAGDADDAETTEGRPGSEDQRVDDAAPSPRVAVTGTDGGRQSPAEGRERRARLFFVSVDDTGSISLHGLLRTIAYENAPLTATLNELLAGPASTELHQGYISLIPPGVQLRRVAVQGSVATIDFSEQFRFNRLGQEGLSAQLQQIVYSATEFSTVTAVQILINGEKVDYLGPEGLFVGDPIGRSSF